MYVKCCPSQTLWEGFRIGLASFMVVGFWTTNSPHYTTFFISLHVYVHLLLTIKYLQLFFLSQCSWKDLVHKAMVSCLSKVLVVGPFFSQTSPEASWLQWLIFIFISLKFANSFWKIFSFLLDKWHSSRYLTGKTEALTKSILHCPVKTMQNAVFPEVQWLERTAKHGHKISASNFIS